MDLVYIFWGVFACLFACLPVVLVKYYIQTKNILFIVSSLISYCLLMYAYTYLLPEQDMTIMNIVLVCLFVTLLFLGAVVYKKSLVPYLKLNIL